MENKKNLGEEWLQQPSVKAEGQHYKDVFRFVS